MYEQKLFLVTASLCLIIALIEAWVMTVHSVYKPAVLDRVIKNYRDLVRSHIDFLMMSMLFFALYAVIVALSISVPPVIAWLSLIGGILNPLGFLVLAINPKDPREGSQYSKFGSIFTVVPLSIGMFYMGFKILFVALFL